MSGASPGDHDTPSSAMPNDATKSDVIIDNKTCIVYHRAEDDVVTALLQLDQSASVKVRSSTVVETHKSSSTNSTGGLKVACGQTVSVHAANAKKDTWSHKRTRIEGIYFNRKKKLRRKQAELRVREEELCREVMELEERYVALDKELVLERMHNGTSKQHINNIGSE